MILLDQLNGLIIQNEDGSKDDEIHKNISVLVDMHTDVIQFLQEMRQVFFGYYFIDISALVFQKTVELFAIISVSCLK